jgi:hypothetical protein
VLCEMDAVEMSEIDEKSVSFFWRCFAFLSSSRIVNFEKNIDTILFLHIFCNSAY